MRVAVVSDIHANLHALSAVLGEIAGAGVEEVWCLGDVVGYGPRPDECCDAIRERASVTLCGNHDLAVLGTLDVAEFAGDAAVAARWTARELGDESRSWLASLRPLAVREDAELYHGSARDPVWEYVLGEEAALATFAATMAPLVLVGHSHVPLVLAHDGAVVEGGLAPAGAEIELGGPRLILNPGSVGQPRDGDPRAAWLLVDFGAGRATFHRAAYDVAATQAEIRERALPEPLAARLEHGV